MNFPLAGMATRSGGPDAGNSEIYACSPAGGGTSAAERAEGSILPADQDSQDLLKILASIPLADPAYGSWWGTPDGHWLYEEIGNRIGGPISAGLRNTYGVSYEASDVANTAFTALRQDFVHTYIVRAADPWAYLSQVIKREMMTAAGAHFRTELTDEALFSAAVPAAEQPAVSLHEATDMTHQVLAPATPAHLHESLKDAIRYFAEQGATRLSHVYTRATTDDELTGLGLVREEILAIGNAVLGSRPNNSQTSLIAAFLADPGFDPRSSILHRRALKKFESRMAGAVRQEALVG